MRHSIKTKISILIFGCVMVMMAAIIIMNSVFLDRFYIRDKEQGFEVAYDQVNEYLVKCDNSEITEDEFKQKLEMVTAISNVSIMIVNNDWSIYYASMRDVDEFVRRLQNSLFNSILSGRELKDIDGVSRIKDGGNYAIYEIYNTKMNDTYLELIGNTDNGKMIYMSLGVRSIKENVDIANRFILYVGIVVGVIAIFAASLMGDYISRPIKALSHIAERMSELDFDAKYESNDKSEIGILGNSMNTLSSKLKNTISELKTANVELLKDIETKEQVDEMRKEFLANVSHELKTPIALIQGYAEGLKEGINDDPESMAFYCDVIMDEAGKMNNMVKELLTLNQIEFGNQQLDMERFDITEVIRAIIAAKKLLADKDNITIEFDREKPLFVWADEYKVEEVITNYLTNAIHYCKYDKKIIISVTENDGRAHVSVFNTGDRIPDSELDNIWVKFYKVDKARTREYGGSGIGLSIVKAIMEQHKQKYGVINHDNGVEFWFELDAKAL